MTHKSKRNLAVVIPAMCLPFLAALFYFVLFTDQWFPRVIYAGTKVFTVVWPALAVWAILREKIVLDRDVVKHLKALPWGLLLGLAIFAAMVAVMYTPIWPVIRTGTDQIRAKAESLGVLEHFWGFAIFISVVHSLIEEYYWRWFVFGRLREITGTPVAHVLAAVAFAAHHVVIATQMFPWALGVALGGVGVGVGGLIFSMLYDRQKTLAGAWLCHMLADVGIMVAGYKLLFQSPQ